MSYWDYKARQELLKKRSAEGKRYDQEYHNQKVEEYKERHPEERREQVNTANRDYYARQKEDPEWLENHREQAAASMRKSYRKKRDTMTPEQEEEYRKMKREENKRHREKVKAEAEADPEKLAALRAKRAEQKRLYRAKKKAEAEAAKKQGN